jgi:choline-sulfatase/uncharacterized sulfatase
MPTRPNVLFILSDQHNAKCLGHQGHPNAVTPHLDRLAREGVRLDNAVTQNPICTPSRVSLISGQYCHNHGFYGLGGPNPGGLPTIFGHFRRAGYRTGAIGKIHCPEYWVEDDCDEFHETCSGCSIGGRSAEYTRYLRQRDVEHLVDHERLPELGPQGSQKLDGRPSLTTFEDSAEGWSVQQAERFIARCSADGQPFFLHVSMARPHQCFTPAQPFWDLYEPANLVLPPSADYDLRGQAPHLVAQARRYRDRPWAVFEPQTYEAARLRRQRGYLGNVSHVDHAVGQLLQTLSRHGREQDTIVIYGSDHGDYACEHGLMEKAPGICHDAVTRVPMIWRWPGAFPAGHVTRQIVENIDLVPTLCRLAGLEPMDTADGQDISPLLRGEDRPVHRIGVTEFAWSRSVRMGRFRFVHYPKAMFGSEYPEGFGELYDLEADPWEMRNLYADGGHDDVIRQMRDELLEWLVTTTRPRTVLGVDQRNGREAPGGDRVRVRNGTWSYGDGKLSPQSLREADAAGRRYYL